MRGSGLRGATGGPGGSCADAARAGKAVLLEKPIAADVAGAERLADVIGGAGMASVVVLSWRYAVPVRAFLAQAASFDAVAGEARSSRAHCSAARSRRPGDWSEVRCPTSARMPHEVDVQRGLHLQRIIADAESQLVSP